MTCRDRRLTYFPVWTLSANTSSIAQIEARFANWASLMLLRSIAGCGLRRSAATSQETLNWVGPESADDAKAAEQRPELSPGRVCEPWGTVKVIRRSRGAATEFIRRILIRGLPLFGLSL
jgi:hypothetical protein